ncbi:MAG: heat shock protein HspQ [bacterium]|mgnify:FL=1|jgi:heat shock protein HspQ|tara:strand:+ start:260 stop:589 length:330 start_codon:yes stop_codon:yes gene_type:complete
MADEAKFKLGQVVRHRLFDFRGIIFDVDPLFNNTDEWYERIPEERRPRKDQPFYHLLAENEDKTTYIAYVSQQNLEKDDSKAPFNHPSVNLLFDGNDSEGNYIVRQSTN